jgi:hypothetical protein
MRIVLVLMSAGLLQAQSYNLTVYSSMDPTLGVNGHLQAFMSTSFAFADNSFFTSNTNPDPVAVLSKLSPQHMRMVVSTSVQTTDATSCDATSWDFTTLNAALPKLTSVGDHDPVLALYSAPQWMTVNCAGLSLSPSHFADYAAYCANLVRYINLGQFTDSAGVIHTAPTGISRINWWSIYNEPDNNMFTGQPYAQGQQYAQLYNLVVSAMKSADPTIKIVAGELSYFDMMFVAGFGSNVTAGVDAFSIHYYPIGCTTLADGDVMSDTAKLLQSLGGNGGYQSMLNQHPLLQGVPVWLTENNLSYVYNNENGTSSCDDIMPFAPDPRAGTPFFAAWRPYFFSFLAKNGWQSLHHWDYWAGVQFGEVSFTDAPYIAYWVDSYLANAFRGSSPGPTILCTSTLNAAVEPLAVQNADNSVAIMLANYGQAADGSPGGANISVTLDLSPLIAKYPGLTTGTEVLIDSSTVHIDPTTNVATAPSAQTISLPTPTIQFQHGYGVAFIRLSMAGEAASEYSAIAPTFGNQAVGAASAPQTVTVTSTGANPLNVTNIGASGDFSQTNNCGIVMTPQDCAIAVTFTPTTSGFRTGAITVTDNGSNSPQQILLSGVGVSSSAVATVSLSTVSLNFGAQTVNSASAAKTVTLTNDGGTTLAVSGVTASGNFTQTNNCTSVAASATCTINVTFTPTASGISQGSVVIVDSATGSPQVIRLLGTGINASAAAIGFSNVSLNFGNQTTSTTSSAQTITVTNPGGATLTITAIAATGDFAASGGCVTSLSAGATCTMTVTFAPTVTGARRGTVVVTDNASGSPQVVELFGNGT